MKTYTVSANGKQILTTEAINHDMAYRGVCCWFLPETPVTICDESTGKCFVYTRALDKGGNLIAIFRH